MEIKTERLYYIHIKIRRTLWHYEVEIYNIDKIIVFMKN